MSVPESTPRAPRIVVGGLSGDAGKTLVSLALLLGLRERGANVRAFKKGPDYIDAAWLAWASGGPVRNLDTWLAGFDAVRRAFACHALRDGLNLVEGNRGLFDGTDAEGTHSTAELAKALDAPVLLVVDARKATRTLAALVLGCRTLDPRLDIAGVVLNRVAGGRHESLARAAIESSCGVPVVGAIPRMEGDRLPGRHLGLVTPEEHESIEQVRDLSLTAARHLDLSPICRMWEAPAQRAGEPNDGSRCSTSGLKTSAGSGGSALLETCVPCRVQQGAAEREGPTIAYLRDSAFSFYYPDNLEALEEAGAALVAVSSLSAASLPSGIHALYIGGGFPETHASRLAGNASLLASIRRAAEDGLPIYAECGGLTLLSRALLSEGRRYEMAGVFPFDVQMCARPQGHGYAALLVDAPNPFFALGTALKGHEFHYSRIAGSLEEATACAVLRGTGCGSGRDAVVAHNVWASYVHLHTASAPGWAIGLVGAAEKFRHGGE